MKNTFFEECGENADFMGDIGARFKAVASELYSLLCHSDYVLKQALVQTATGEYLDYHAELREIVRKTSSKASGELTFSITQATTEAITIDAGTVCSASGRAYIQFATDEKAVIPAGATKVTVSASAIENGSDYNVGAGEVSVMVNPPTGVEQVTNEAAFDGGYDEECDDALRKRIIASYSVPSTGVSIQYLKDLILKIDEIIDCNVEKNDTQTIRVYVRTKSNELPFELSSRVENVLMIAKITNCDVTVSLANEESYTLNVEARISNIDKADEIEQSIRERLKEFDYSLKIGEGVGLNNVAFELADIDGIEFCDVSSKQAAENHIICDGRTYLSLSSIEVSLYE
jgi:phage-related baseplate assembly protein